MVRRVEVGADAWQFSTAINPEKAVGREKAQRKQGIALGDFIA